MTKDDIFTKIKAVLEKVSTLPADGVTKKAKLKMYVPPPAVLSLALAVDKAFPRVDLTDLSNSLYDPIATVGDLVDYIDEVYNG
jgi:hypothetical protein